MLWSLRSLSTLRSARICFPSRTLRSFSFTSKYCFPRISNPNVYNVNTPPSFKQEVIRTSGFRSFSEEVKYPSVRNQVLFFVFGSFVAFSLAAKYTNHETDYWMRKLSDSGNVIFKFRSPNNDELRRARYYDLAKQLQAGLTHLRETVEEWPFTIKEIIVWSYVQVVEPVLQMPEGRRIGWTIGALNGLIWLAWQIPRLRPVMMRSFTHNPLSGLSYTLLTSTFSHKSLLHFLFNAMALTSFGSAAAQYMLREQNHSPTGLREANVGWHFMAFFVSAGLFSGLVSHIVSARIRFPQLVLKLVSNPSAAAGSASSIAGGSLKSAAQLSAKDASSSILPSLGASGAIYAAVTLTAMAFPETEISLIFPPTFPIPIQWGVGGMVALDVMGVLRGWRMFDHWAHLGGAAFGVMYYYYGMRLWDFFRVANLGSLPPHVKVSKENS